MKLKSLGQAALVRSNRDTELIRRIRDLLNTSEVLIAVSIPKLGKRLKVSLLTGGQDIHYALGLLSGLVSQDLEIDFVGGDSMKDAEVTKHTNVRFTNIYGSQSIKATLTQKLFRIFKYYALLIKYSATTDCSLFHILWLNRLTYFDRTILSIYYKIIGKKIVYTAHDINYRNLVGKDSIVNNLTLNVLYRSVDHIIVHTEKMRDVLASSHRIDPLKISIVPFGINEVLVDSSMTSVEARKKLKFDSDEKVVLFFGNIAPYKGVELLIKALNYIVSVKRKRIRLLITGRIKHECIDYWDTIQKMIVDFKLENYITQRIEYIPENEAEVYFKAADLLVLPYKNIFQSGLTYSAFRFGLPVVATDVGSLRDDIVEGKTGFICKANDPEDLAEKICTYFDSSLYRNLHKNRQEIIQYAREKYSWESAARITVAIYKKVSGIAN